MTLVPQGRDEQAWITTTDKEVSRFDQKLKKVFKQARRSGPRASPSDSLINIQFNFAAKARPRKRAARPDATYATGERSGTEED